MIGFQDHIYQVDYIFLTTKNDGIWKHNDACNDYCNFYNVQYPFEIELPVVTGQTITTMRSVQYILECYRKDTYFMY